LNGRRLFRKIVCTQQIVDTMLKDSEISRYAARRTHRTYTREFKAELVAACQEPGTSIAALAGAHAMNANVLHRWLKEHARSGCHSRLGSGNANRSNMALQSQVPAFIPVQLPAPGLEPAAQAIKVDIRKGALTMTITWPAAASADFASWAASILK
jgi:transposase-like protein